MIVAGLDEAGRGSLLGPLAVAAVAVRAEEQRRLRELGARDSKRLTPGARRRVAGLVERAARWSALLIPQWTVDASTRAGGGNLNLLEAAAFAKLIAELGPDVAIVDAPDPRPARFGALISSMLEGMGRSPRVVARHRADATYPVVGAASVIAKVVRDEGLAEWAGRYGYVGSGYPHDARTLEFVENWRRAWGDYPYIARGTWSTLRRRGLE